MASITEMPRLQAHALAHPRQRLDIRAVLQLAPLFHESPSDHTELGHDPPQSFESKRRHHHYAERPFVRDTYTHIEAHGFQSNSSQEPTCSLALGVCSLGGEQRLADQGLERRDDAGVLTERGVVANVEACATTIAIQSFMHSGESSVVRFALALLGAFVRTQLEHWSLALHDTRCQ